MVTKALLENVTVLQANQFPIQTVKLFQSSSNAEITRSFPLSFLRCQDEPQVVEINHLPACIQSVNVSATSTSGNVTILDHYHTPITKPQSATPSSQTLRELETKRLRLEDEKRLRQQSFTFLTTYMDSLAQCKSHNQAEAAQMVSFFDEFVEIGITRSSAIAEIDGKLVDVGNKITEEMERLSKLESDLSVTLVIIVSCKGDVPAEAAELTVHYVVEQVSWKPAYDLHITMTGDTPSSTATLDFRCTVTQWTGEDWENISLALTTADQVSQLIQLPEPKRIDISLAQESVPLAFPPSRPVLFGQAMAPAFQSIECDVGISPLAGLNSVFRTTTMPLSSVPQQQPPPPGHSDVGGEAPEANVPSQTVSQFISHDSKDPITHIASGCIFIPSDHAAHHVLVVSFPLQVEFMRVVVPSVDTRVYYTCEVKNNSTYVLLPGTVKAYLNDKHVSSTEIRSTDVPQILECSLAVDTGLKVMQSRTPDAMPSQDFNVFSTKATTTYTSATVLHNTHAEPIRGVVVRNSIPLPADPRVTIVLKEPTGLAEIDEGSVSAKEGCLARWSTMGGRKGKRAGLFEWVCDVNPGTEVLKAVWEVNAPQEMKVVEQARS